MTRVAAQEGAPPQPLPSLATHLRPLAAILAALLAGHALLLINDARVLDDWLYLGWLAEGEFHTLMALHAHTKNVWAAYYFVPFSLLPDPLFAFRVVDFLAWTLAAVFIYGILVTSELFARWESACVAMLSGTYPGYYTHWSITLSGFVFCYAVFCGAAWLALSAERRRGSRHRILRVLACAGFFISFSLTSLLVFYAAFVAEHVRRYSSINGQSWRAGLVSYIRDRAEFVALPVVFWLARMATGRFFNASEDYNTISLSPAGLAKGYGVFAEAIAQQVGTLLASPAFWVVLLVGGAVVLVRRRPPEGRTAGAQNACYLIAAVGMLLLATFPYVVVGKPPSDTYSWGTRVNILVGLPMALIADALLRIAAGWKRSLERFRIPVMLALVCSGAAALALNYLKFQAYSVEIRSLEGALRAQREEARRFSVFGVVTTTNGIWLTHNDYDWPYFLRATLGGGLTRGALMEPYGTLLSESRKGPYTPEEINHVNQIGHFFGVDIPVNGRQATLVIYPGPTRDRLSDAALAANYWRVKFLEPHRVEQFLSEVLVVRIIPKE